MQIVRAPESFYLLSGEWPSTQFAVGHLPTAQPYFLLLQPPPGALRPERAAGGKPQVV